MKYKQLTDERYAWIDSVKAIGIFWVIMGHHLEHPLYSYIYSFHMPLFFFISGLLLPARSTGFGTLVVKRAQSLLVPYFAFALLLYAFWWFLGTYLDSSVIQGASLSKNFIGIFYAQGQLEYMRWGVVLWFLPCMFLTVLLFYGINQFSLVTQILLLACFAALGFILPTAINLRLPWSIDIMLIAIGFLWLGKHLAPWLHSTQLSAKTLMAMALLLAINLLAYALNSRRVDMYLGLYGEPLYFYISAIGGTLFYCLFAKVLPPSAVLSFIGANSLVLFVLHMRALTVINAVFAKFPAIAIDSSTLLGATIISLLQIILLIPAILIINRYLPFLLGKGPVWQNTGAKPVST